MARTSMSRPGQLPASQPGRVCAVLWSRSKQATCSSSWSDMDREMNQSEDELPGAKEQNSVEAVLAYHRRTKHHLHRYAASLGYQDWATQPDPFRTYAGAERIELPFLADRLDAAYAELYFPGVVPAMPLERNSVAMLFELALG